MFLPITDPEETVRRTIHARKMHESTNSKSVQYTSKMHESTNSEMRPEGKIKHCDSGMNVFCEPVSFCQNVAKLRDD